MLPNMSKTLKRYTREYNDMLFSLKIEERARQMKTTPLKQNDKKTVFEGAKTIDPIKSNELTRMQKNSSPRGFKRMDSFQPG